MNPSLLSQLLSPLCKSSSVRQSQIKKNCNFEICHLIAYLTFGNFVEFFKFDRVSLGDSPFGNTIGQSQSQQYQGAVQKGQSFIDWPNNIWNVTVLTNIDVIDTKFPKMNFVSLTNHGTVNSI